MLFNFAKRLWQPRTARRTNRCPSVTRLGLEHLEDRLVPSGSGVDVLGSYSGLNVTQSGYVPPDTNGAAGPNNYVETVAQTIALYSPKSTGASAAIDSLKDFWYTQGKLSPADAGSSLSDPVIVWDEQIQRFIVGDQDVDSKNHVSTFDIAVSKTGSPATLTSNDWNYFQVHTTEANYDADYPGNLGWNNGALVFTLNMFNTGGGANHVQVDSIDINALKNSTALTEGVNAFQSDFVGFSLRPTVIHDSSNANDPMWFVEEGGNDASLNVVKMANVLSSAPTFVTTNLAVNSYSQAVPELQPDGTAITTKTDSRIMKAAMQNGLIVAAHQVSDTAGNLDEIQWYVINTNSGTPALQQQGDITGGAGTYYVYPGIDINSQGDIGMSYIASGTGTAQYMSVYVTGRSSTDSAGTMETPFLVQAGQTNYINTRREGDLSGISVDSNGSFWIANEYTAANGSWGTTIANFTVAPPATPTGLTATTNLTWPSSSQITLNWNNDPGAASYTLEWSTNNSTWYALTTTSSTSYVESGLQPDTTYYYRVAANNGSGASAYSASISDTTLAATPTGLTATAVSSSQINLSWTIDNSAGGGYAILRSTNSSSGFVLIGTTAAGITTFGDTGLAAGTTYYYEITALNTADFYSGFSGVANAITVPATPTLTAQGSGSAIYVYWQSVTGASNYTLERSTDEVNWSMLTTTGSNQTGYYDTGLTAGATYYYRIQASNAGGSSPWSFEAAAITAPAAPTGITATPVSSSQIDLSWNSDPGATSYTLERSTDDATWFYVTTTNGTSYSDTGLTGDTTYYYTLSASNIAGVSAPSAPVSATTQLATPTGLTTTTVTNYQVSLSWSSDYGATSYTLERSVDQVNWSVLASTSNTSYTDIGLQAGTTYYYRLIASNLTETSPSSVPLGVITTAIVPSTPSIDTVLATEPNEIYVYPGNGGGPNALQYILQRSTDASNWGTIATLSNWTTGYSDTDLQSGTTYYYRIGASNTVGTAYSNVEYAITMPATPNLTATTGATASSETNAQINVRWNSVKSATIYELDRSTDGTNWQWVTTTSGTGFTDAGLQSNTTYYYRITAMNISSVSEGSPPSAPVSAVSSMTANEKYVQSLYEHFLGRSGSKGELDGWTNQMPYIGQQGVANGIARSGEALVRFVNGIYLDFLGRPADSGAIGWVWALQGGQTEEQVMSQILGSPEFYADHGSYNPWFVDALYMDLLGRHADPGGMACFLGQLSGGVSRQTVADEILNSGEFRTGAVTGLYSGAGSTLSGAAGNYVIPNLLNRAPDSHLSDWVNSGADLLSMEVDFASTGEFYNDAQSL